MTSPVIQGRRSFGSRLIGALRLDARAYEDVEHDRSALPQALVVVVASSVATGIGSVYPDAAGQFLSGTLFALVGWIAWSSLMYVIGTMLMPQSQTRADVGELMRTTGFAAAPGLFGVAGLVPGIGWILTIAVSLWMAMAMLLAVRQALDFTSIGRAIFVVVTGWISYLGILLVARAFL